jgi:RND family efflux transporter MFP subunit
MKIWIKSVSISGVVLLGGAGLIYLIFTTEPTATRGGATKETAMLVEVTEVESGSFRPTIEAVGSVIPSREIVLAPRVDGEIVEISGSFTPGGIVEKGQMLARIDPADYQNTLRQRESDLRQAQADLDIEMGRQNVAETEFSLYEGDLTDRHRALVLRRPQLEAAKAQVGFQQAAVNQARLDLERTTIKAPFDAQVLTRAVNVGSQVTAGEPLARLVGHTTYWVETEVPLSHFQWLSLPETSAEQVSEVRVRHATAWPEGVTRIGRLHKVIGELSDRTRLVRLLVTVEDPLSLRPENRDMPKLIVGLFVDVHMEAKELTDVVRLERDYLRSNDTVWVMENHELVINDVDVAFLDRRYAYIRSGLNDGDRVVMTNLSTVVEGAALRVNEPQQNSIEASERDTPSAGDRIP